MNIKIKSKMKMVMLVLMLSFVIPQVTFAFLGIPCLNPFSSADKPDSFWNCTGYDSTAEVSNGTLQGNNTNTTNSGSSLTYSGSGVGGVFDLFQAFLSRALILLISLAIVWFVWNVFRYVIATDEVDKAVAKDKMVWGIIAIFIMVSIWGLVAILQYTFQIFPPTTPKNLGGIMPTF